MLYTAETKITAGINVVFKGDSPTNEGAVTFDSGVRVALPSIAYPGQIRSQRIKFADLTADGSNYYYEVRRIGSTPSLDPGSVNLAGETFDLPIAINIAYVSSNTECDVTGRIPYFPPLLEANKFSLIATGFLLDPVPTDEGDTILSLVWTAANITATGQSAFFCDIVIG